MRHRTRAFRLLLLAGAGIPGAILGSDRLEAQVIRQDRCVECHLDLDEERLVAPARTYGYDIHAERGFGCLSCHGGRLATGEDADEAAGFLSAPAAAQIPALCGRCHSDADFMRDFDPGMRVDQVTEYYTSEHGQRLMATGDPDVATCVDCHPAHEIRPPSDPEASVYALNVAEMCAGCHDDPDLMSGRELATDQLEDWRHGVHGQLMIDDGDVSAPTCNDCHGNHGAAPPGVASVGNVCGQCHATTAELFARSGHLELFADAGLPGCATCHGNHDIQAPDDDFLLETQEEVCFECHDRRDPAGIEFRVNAGLLDSLKHAYARAEQRLEQAEDLGMEVSQAQFDLEEASNALTKARIGVHGMSTVAVVPEVRAGLQTIGEVLAQGDEALEEHRVRRVGLGVSSMIIVLLIVAILLKIRQLEADRPTRDRKPMMSNR